MNKFLFLLFLCTAHAVAATQELFHFPEGGATWTVACEKSGSEKPGSAAQQASPPQNTPGQLPIPQKIDVAQTETLMRTIIHFTNGKTRELWSVPKLDVFVTEGPTGHTFVTREKSLYGSPFSASDFSWIEKGALVEEKPIKFGGTDSFHYRGVLTLPNPSGEGEPIKIPCEAWIDAKTLFPVALRKGDLFGRFTFGAPPESLVIPERFQNRLDHYKVTVGLPVDH